MLVRGATVICNGHSMIRRGIKFSVGSIVYFNKLAYSISLADSKGLGYGIVR